MEILAPAPAMRLRGLSQLQFLAFIFHPSLLADSDCHDVMPPSFPLDQQIVLHGQFISFVSSTPLCWYPLARE